MVFREAARQAGLWLYRIGQDPAEGGREPQPLWNRFARNKAYYDTHRLYSKIRYGFSILDSEEYYNIDNLRSPAYEATEFHVGHWFPGTLPDALPIKKDSKLKAKDVEAIQEVWKASNFASKKQVLARTTTWAGNGFIRVAQRPSDGHPIKRVLEPQYVREFHADDRGFLDYFRYAYPVKRGRGPRAKVVWRTEVYDKERMDLRVWIRDQPLDDYEKEGGAQVYLFAGMGIDFLPVVWAPFVEGSPGMGTGVFEPFLDSIDNVNRAATRLHDMFFRYDRAIWALESSTLTADNVELPAVEMSGSFATAYTNLSDEDRRERGYEGPVRQADGTLTLGGDPYISLPSGRTARPLVAPVDYQAALNIISEDLADLKNKMPELRYNDAIESAARDSGRVLELQLAGATDRAIEARGNAEGAIIRASQMALHIGKHSNPQVEDMRARSAMKEIFANVGDFKEGALDFTFEDRPVLKPTPSDKAQDSLTESQALNEKVNVVRNMGLSVDVLRSELAKLLDVQEEDLEEDEMLNPEGLPEGEGGTEASGNVVSNVLRQAQQGQGQQAAQTRGG